MIHTLSILVKFVCVTAVLLAVAACQPSGASSPVAGTPAVSQSTGTPAGSPLTEPTQAPAAVDSTPWVAVEWTYGPGPLSFLNAAEGLSKLSSYQSTLTLAFHGTKAGQPEEWSTNYVMLAAQDPPRRQLTITNTGEGADPAQVFMVENAGVVYERRDARACTAAVLDPKKSLAAMWEPAEFLPGITGGEKAGSETVNGLAADRYTFDQRAFGPFPPSQSTGQMWVTSSGGFIVRYLVTTVAKADYFGDGIEGTLTWDYQLTDANKPLTIGLPKDCPAGMIDAPRLPDAGDLKNMPGLVSYSTASSLAEAAAFYQQALPSLGWQPAGNPVADKTLAVQDFTRGDQQLVVMVTARAGGTTVQILLGPIRP